MTSSSTPVLSETRVPAIYGTIITEIALSVTFVTLRLLARRLSFGYLRLDLSDWFSVSALFFALAFFITVAVGPVFGLGRHIEAVTDIRGFAIRFHRVVTALASLVAAWTVTTLILGLVVCIPIESLWDNSVPHAHCLPASDIQLGVVSAHVGIEILILLLPIPSVVRLQASPERKRLIILTFMVGGVGCLVSIARIPVSLLLPQSTDLSWQLIPNGLLATTKLTIGFLAVSFPWRSAFFHAHAMTDLVGLKMRTLFRPSGIFLSRYVGITVTDKIEFMRRPNIGGGWMKVPDEEEPKP
ncbi:hypothetical protein EV127DRAFT_517739 [Xylaria flabelliformis]|nr:hypothetical protein EV127DRAFT_517739 [Xylaria flabelliformis]